MECKGKHLQRCKEERPGCLCNRCANDDWDEDDGGDCCDRHNAAKGGFCPITHCKDFMEEI